MPVVEDGDSLRGVEAVIDKDHASRLLANEIGADLLVISTDVPQVALYYGTKDQVCIDRMTVEEAERYHAEGHFPPGSMGPKVKAGIDFIRNGGELVMITNPESFGRALDGETGTRIVA